MFHTVSKDCQIRLKSYNLIDTIRVRTTSGKHPMARNSKLDNLCGNLFFTAIIVRQFARVSIPIVSTAITLLSTLLYLSGYVVWKAGIYQDESKRHALPPAEKVLFDRRFMHNGLYRYSAIIGIFASICALFSLTNPIIAIITAISYFISNSLWSRAEHITLRRLQQDEPDSLLCQAQNIYNEYALLATAISFVAAVSLPLFFVFPALSLTLGVVLSANVFALNLFAFRKWAESGQLFKAAKRQAQHKSADDPKTLSYHYMHQTMPGRRQPLTQPNATDIPRVDMLNEEEGAAPTSGQLRYHP